MARTPLFRALKRALAPYVVESARRAGALSTLGALSRRRLLLGGVALGAVAGCGPESSIAPPSLKPRTHRIVIVGAGLAGLHCAYRLAQASPNPQNPISISVYEANARVGGRIYTERSVFGDGKQPCELGAEFIDVNHKTMQSLAREFGVMLEPRSAIIADTVENLFFVKGAPKDPQLIAPLFRKVADELVALLTSSERDPSLLKSIDISLDEWLKRLPADDGLAVIVALIESACRVEFGLEPDEQSVLNFATLLVAESAESFSPYADASRSAYAPGGNDTFMTQMALLLQEQIKLNSRLKAVRADVLDGERIYTLTFQTDGVAAFEVTADRVVFALPFSVLRRLEPNVPIFSAEKWNAIKELGYGSSSKLVADFQSAFWRQPAPGVPGAAGVLSDAGFQQVYEATSGKTLLVNLMGGDRATQAKDREVEQSVQQLLVELEAVFPNISEQYKSGSAVRMDWNSAQFARGGRSCFRAGQWGLRGIIGKRDGNLHFCGEHCSLDYPGTMEGAAQSGALTAAEILDDLRLPYPEKLRELLDGLQQSEK